MRYAFLLLLLLFSGLALKAQTPPTTLPACRGQNGTASMTISGNTNILLDNLSKFTTADFSTININVKSSKDYRLYIAAEISGMAQSPTNDLIPIGTFTASSSLPGSAPAGILTLNNINYQLLVENTALTNGTTPRLSVGRDHLITINRNTLDTFDQFKQAPGTHTLNLYFYLCQ